MANARDVAAFIHARTGGVDRLKLQKLLYYAQAWTLVWDNRPLFSERIEAWVHGPVVPSLWRTERDRQVLRETLGQEGMDLSGLDNLTDQELENIDAVIDHYNQFSGWQLREMTHRERPWRDARGDLRDDEPSRAEITHASMRRCFARIEADQEPHPTRILADDDDDVSDEELELILKAARAAREEPPDR